MSTECTENGLPIFIQILYGYVIGKCGFFYPDVDPDHSPNLIGSKLVRDLSPESSRSSNHLYLSNPANRKNTVIIIIMPFWWS